MLKPGMFGRIRLPMGEPHQALLVIDRAIASDQGLKYVYVLDSENKAQYRRVTTGPLQPDGLRVVGGLRPDDWVVIGGLQQVRPKMQVQPDKVPMPTLTQAPAGSPDTGTGKQPDKQGGKQGPAGKAKP
jgi:multidrug efflux system membrane fusion protein